MKANSVAPALTGQFRERPEAEGLELIKTKRLGRVVYYDQGSVVLPRSGGRHRAESDESPSVAVAAQASWSPEASQ